MNCMLIFNEISSKLKNLSPSHQENIDKILELDTKNRSLIQEKEKLESEKKTLSKQNDKSLFAKSKDLSKKIGTLLSILLKKNSAINSEVNETSENSQSLTKAAS